MPARVEETLGQLWDIWWPRAAGGAGRPRTGAGWRRRLTSVQLSGTASASAQPPKPSASCRISRLPLSPLRSSITSSPVMPKSTLPSRTLTTMSPGRWNSTVTSGQARDGGLVLARVGFVDAQPAGLQKIQAVLRQASFGGQRDAYGWRHRVFHRQIHSMVDKIKNTPGMTGGED